MKEIWKQFVKYAANESSAVKEARRSEGASDAELSYSEGAYNAAYTCAVASGYKGNYLSDVVIAVDGIVENYIKNGGNPYGVSDYMDKVFERLGDMGVDGQI